jgi:hypothetical protein
MINQISPTLFTIENGIVNASVGDANSLTAKVVLQNEVILTSKVVLQFPDNKEVLTADFSDPKILKLKGQQIVYSFCEDIAPNTIMFSIDIPSIDLATISDGLVSYIWTIDKRDCICFVQQSLKLEQPYHPDWITADDYNAYDANGNIIVSALPGAMHSISFWDAALYSAGIKKCLFRIYPAEIVDAAGIDSVLLTIIKSSTLNAFGYSSTYKFPITIKIKVLFDCKIYPDIGPGNMDFHNGVKTGF